MSTPIKAGWLEAPCTIMRPGLQGAKAVVKVTSIKRDLDTTTLTGTFAMSKERVVFDLPNYEYVGVL